MRNLFSRILTTASSSLLVVLLSAPFAIAQQVEQKKRLIDRLDDSTRAKVVAALAALVMLGFLMLALAWMGARFTRRYMTSNSHYIPPKRTPLDLDDWARKPLHEAPAKPASDDDD